MEAALAATVEIEYGSGRGSGFILDPTGLVATACHVVEEHGGIAREVRVRICPKQADERELSATVCPAHRVLDYALPWLDSPGPYPFVACGEPGRLRHTDVVFALGSPYGLSNTVSRGVVGNPRSTRQCVEYIQTDAAITHGNSGGPLVDREGRVVGINVMGLSTAEGEVDAGKFALPLDYLWGGLRDAMHRGKDACLGAFFCPSCGHTEFERRTWYGHNCGAQVRT